MPSVVVDNRAAMLKVKKEELASIEPIFKVIVKEVKRFVEYGFRRLQGVGRLYPNKESTGASLWVPKKFRGFLFPDHVDLDLEAAHLSILITLAKYKLGLNLPIFDYS